MMYRKDLWQSMDEYGKSDSDLQVLVEKEFPVDASVFTDAISRRHFFKIMGASFALAGLTSCKFTPAASIFSFAKADNATVPGKSVYYARSLDRGGNAVGVLVECYMGRPIKIEGHPEHPMSLGASDAIMQAEILNLYDPDRLKHPLIQHKPGTIKDFQVEWKKRSAFHNENKGQGLRILFEKNNSDTFSDSLKKIRSRFPEAKFISYDALSPGNNEIKVQYDFSKANVILSFDNDFLCDESAGLRYTKDFSDKRRIHHHQSKMNRLFSIESGVSLTGSMADHRLARSRDEVECLIEKLALLIGIQFEPDYVHTADADDTWLRQAFQELNKERGTSLILAGEFLSPKSHLLVHLINEKLKNTGSTLSYLEHSGSTKTSGFESFDNLITEMKENKVLTLFILSTNPVYTTSSDRHFSELLKKVPFTASLSITENETTGLTGFTLNEGHTLEHWSDSRAIDGTLSINQPMIEPLFDSVNALELLHIIAFNEIKSSREIVKDYWMQKKSEAWWNLTLEKGFDSSGTAGKRTTPDFNRDLLKKENAKTISKKIELHFTADPFLRDGRFANNGWLQELPRPVTKLCWSNAVLISPEFAQKQKIKNEDIISLKTSAGSMNVPAWIVPGQAANVLVVHFGHGRKKAGSLGTNSGSDAFAIFHSKNASFVERDIEITNTHASKALACTQEQYTHSDREPVKVETISRLPFLQKEERRHATLYKDSPLKQSEEYAWGMSIDLNVCNGCSACVIACQAENNIPIVGEEEVKRGRAMHWLRIDRYFEGPPDLARARFQPLACVHCEKAPCEVVCPVNATVHSSEGLNEMVYNRCVGTRYCSNNCPYKVRRFNFLEYHYRESEMLKLRANPEVTVRSRGVMEKCTYCVQRINEARSTAELEGRKIKDGEIKTACEQACAARAITFGNILDQNSAVKNHHDSATAYELLGELGTLPRTRYLTKFTNPLQDMK